MARLVFMGSPALAVPTLDALAREHELLAVFTQPDKPAGRGRKLTAAPVKIWADERGVPVYQPRSLRKEPDAIEALRVVRPDAIVVVAYGLILPQAVLDLPSCGCLNLHASLLPKYRGAAPIPAAILAGEAETGVTVMRMDAGVDTGPIYAQARQAIRPDDTSATLGVRLAELGARLMLHTLPKILRRDIQPVEQDHAQATLSPKLDKDDGRIDWSRPALYIDRMIRAYTPWPGAWTQWDGLTLKIVRAVASDEGSQASASRRVGQVIPLGRRGAGVVTGAGVLELREVQLAGKHVLPIDEFLRGQPGLVGSVLGAGGNDER
ncbi:MAG TPA: methionyl-tRNA formyltransferase [Anaerolineae bacterium]|nr:methionyl-tRNA formyltransferase [Anaerolineae bacterium]